MSVRDDRLPPFAWLALDDLERIRRDVPAGRQAAARNALLALAEAASRRRDGRHRGQRGDTLRELATLSGVSERRLRDPLRELERVGLCRIEEARDAHNRPLPTTYVLTGPDDSTGYPDDSTEHPDEATAYPDTLAPNRPGLRARERGEQTESLCVEPEVARDAHDGLSRDLDQTAEHVRGILQRGIESTSDEHARPPGRAAIRALLERHAVTADDAEAIAWACRQIVQSQDRAPNIAGLYAQRLERHVADLASSAVEPTERDSQPATSGAAHTMTSAGHPQALAGGAA
jgi:hypothetical protein